MGSAEPWHQPDLISHPPPVGRHFFIQSKSLVQWITAFPCPLNSLAGYIGRSKYVEVPDAPENQSSGACQPLLQLGRP